MRILPFIESPSGIAAAREGLPASGLDGPPCCPDHPLGVGLGLADPAATDRIGPASATRSAEAAAAEPEGVAAAPGSDALVDREEPGPADVAASRGRRSRALRRAPTGPESRQASFPAIVAAALGPSAAASAADSPTRRAGAAVGGPAFPTLVPGSADDGFAAWLAAVIPAWAPGSRLAPLAVRNRGGAPATPETAAAASPAYGVANTPGSGAADPGAPGSGIAAAGSPSGRGVPGPAGPMGSGSGLVGALHASEPGPSEPRSIEWSGTEVRLAAGRRHGAQPALADPPRSPMVPSGPRSTSAGSPAPSADPANPTPPPLPAGHPAAAPLTVPARPTPSAPVSGPPAAVLAPTPAPDPRAVAGQEPRGGPRLPADAAKRAAERAGDPRDHGAAPADPPRRHEALPVEAAVRAAGAPPPEATPAVASTDGPLPAPTQDAVDRLFGLVATRIRQASREGLPTLEATFHEPALGTVRLSVRGLPDGPVVATLVVASEALARVLERARQDPDSRSADLAALDLRIRVEPGIGGRPVPDLRGDHHLNPGQQGPGQPDPGPGAGDADRREGAERGRGGGGAAVGGDPSASSGSTRGDDGHGGLPGSSLSIPAVDPSTRARRRAGGVRPVSGALAAAAPPALRRPGGIDIRL